jgi:hypothetical protein
MTVPLQNRREKRCGGVSCLQKPTILDYHRCLARRDSSSVENSRLLRQAAHACAAKQKPHTHDL